MEKISVIVLSYNNMNFIKTALDSALTQDYPDWELIIADDGSKNFNNYYIEKYIRENACENCKHVIVFSNEQNHGTVKNLNKAIAYAEGEYIIPIAADDAFYNQSVLSNFAKSFASNKEAFILTSQAVQYDEELKMFLKNILTEDQIKLLKYGSLSDIYGDLCFHSFLPAGGTAYRKTIFSQYGLFDESYRLVEDWPFSLKMTRLGIRYCFCDFISMKHRKGGVSQSKIKTQAAKQYHTDLIQVMEKEIKPNLLFAPVKVQKKINTLCEDKLLFYKLRYEFPKKKLIEKAQWLLTTKKLLPAVFRGVKRRTLKNE